MFILGDYKEQCTFAIHNMPNDEFNKVKARTPGTVIDLDKTWLLTTFIGKVELNFFSDKVFCKSCGVKFQDSPEMEVCEDCYEFIEEEEKQERLRQKREDRYDESRGH